MTAGNDDPGGLPREVIDLLVRHVETMEQTEVLLALKRSEGAARADQIARELRISPAAATSALQLFVERGLATYDAATSTFTYAPSSTALGKAVDALAVAYNTRPVTLIKALYARPSTAIQSFADAFRIRKPGE